MKEPTSRRLCDLRDGERGRISGIEENCPIRQRLTELGFIEGTEVRRLFTAASGDPAAYALYGTLIALRKSDSEKVLVVPVIPHR